MKTLLTLARRMSAILSGFLSLSLIVLLGGCESAEQAGPQGSTAAPQQTQPRYPGLGRQPQADPSSQSEASAADANFFKSIEAGDVVAVQAALDAGADPNAKNAQGLSALQLAAAQGHSAVVEALLAKQSVLEVGETQPRSPQFGSLQLAARQGDVATIQALIDHGVDINVQDPHTRQTALWSAVQQGQVDTVNMLLEKGANPNIKGPLGSTPLIEAVTQGYVDVAVALLRHGANPNATDDLNKWTALMTAAARADAEMVELLVKHGVDMHITDPQGNTAVDIAYRRNDAKTIAAIEAESRSSRGLASANTQPTGLILIPGPSEAAEKTEQPQPVEPPAAVAAASPSAPQPPAGAAETRRSEQIAQLFARAQRQFQKKNLTTPKDDNALDTCLAIFELAPGHAEAVDLIRKMEQQYRDWATTTKSAKRRKTYTEKAQQLAALVP